MKLVPVVQVLVPGWPISHSPHAPFHSVVTFDLDAPSCSYIQYMYARTETLVTHSLVKLVPVANQFHTRSHVWDWLYRFAGLGQWGFSSRLLCVTTTGYPV